MPLPPGFTIDSPTASPPSGGPPPGFVVQQGPDLSAVDKAKLIYKMMGAAPTPERMLKEKVLDPAGEALAEAGGRTGHKAISIPAAAVGTMISEAPAFAGAASSLSGLYNQEDPTPFAEAIKNTPSDLSPRYTALDEKAGISGDLPIRRGTVPKFPGLNGLPANVPPPEAPMVNPSSYPKDTNALLNFMKARISAYGDKLSSQELRDYDSMLGTMFKGREISPGTDQYALASQRASENTPLLNKAVPGRADLDTIYAISKKLRIAPEIAKNIWSYLGPKFRWGDILVQ